MLYREIIAVSFQIHTTHINALCGGDTAVSLWLEIGCGDNRDQMTVTEWGITNGDSIISDVLLHVTTEADHFWKKRNAAWPSEGSQSAITPVPTAALASVWEVGQQVIWSLPGTFYFILQIRYDNSKEIGFLRTI